MLRVFKLLKKEADQADTHDYENDEENDNDRDAKVKNVEERQERKG